MKEAQNEWYHTSSILMVQRQLPKVLFVAALPWETSQEEQYQVAYGL